MIKLPSYLTGFSSRADNSAGIRFATQELNPQDFADLQSLNGKFGWLLFSENQLQAEDVPTGDADEDKSPSKRLRAALFVLWQQRGKDGEFEVFYRTRMERFIEAVKAKLD